VFLRGVALNEVEHLIDEDLSGFDVESYCLAALSHIDLLS
jgi:hypothetical protein